MSAEASSRSHDPGALRFRGAVSEPMVGVPPATISRATAPTFRARQLRPRGREWLVAREGWLGFAGVILTGTLVVLSAAHTFVLLPASMRPLPNAYAGAFGQGGIDIGLGGVVAVLILMFLSYVAMVRGGSQLTARPVLIGIACLNLLVLLGPPLLSTDVFSYISYGRIGRVYGSDPYLYGPYAFRFDQTLYPLIGAQWTNTPTAYGPLFTALSYLLAPLTIATQVIVYKTIAAISSLVIVLVVWSAARLRNMNPVKAVAIVGLNPVIVIYGVGGGHNDLLMLAISVVAVYVLLQQKQRTSGALIVTAAAVKLTAGLMLPFAFAQSAGERTGPARRRALLTAALVTAACVLIFSFATFGTGPLHLLGTLQKIQSQGGLHSIYGLLLAPFHSAEVFMIAGFVADAVLLVCLAWLVRRVWTGQLDWISGAGWGTVAMLCTASLLVPWYVAWLVPLAALSRDRRLLMAAVVLTGLALTTL